MASRAADIIHTPNVTGVHANFLRQSLRTNGLDPEHLPPYEDLRHMQGSKTVEIDMVCRAWGGLDSRCSDGSLTL